MSTSAPAKEVFLTVIPQDTSDGLKVFIWGDELFYSMRSAQHILPRQPCKNCNIHNFSFNLESDQPIPFIKIQTEIIVLLFVWFVWLYAKNRNHQDDTMFVRRVSFDAADSDLRCVRPQWKLNQNCPSPATPLTDADNWPTEALCFRTGINYGWSSKIMASVGSSKRTAFLDSPPSLSYSMTSKWAIHR